MHTPLRKIHPLLKITNKSLIDLPCSSSINLWWNLGSLLGMCLMIQMITGVFLAMHYTPDINLAFNSIIHTCRDVNNGWLLRNIHANGASLFFLCMYMHVGRGVYYGSYKLQATWNLGLVIMLLTMATAFLGYVLPWGQMSLWGATVITNLMSAIPYLGKSMVVWLWGGGVSISNATLTRFFTLHFLMPFMLLALVMTHLLFLHQTGSNNPLGLNSNYDKIPFHPYYTTSDLMGMLVIMLVFSMFILLEPRILSDPENYTPANPLVTPIHIQPEWYFLFVYAILRSIPNKLGGVMAMITSIIIIMILPLTNKMKFQSTMYYPPNKTLFWMMLSNLMLLTWVGARPVETPFIVTGQLLTLSYFSIFMLLPMTLKIWDSMTD